MGPAAAALLRLLLLGAAAAAAAPGAGPGECGRRQFRCGDGSCIARSWVCDGSAECRDGSDETAESCSSVSCSPSEFSCGGLRGRCVPLLWRCDGHHDCEDGSDELQCSPRSCGPDQLRCGSGSCVSRAFACDGDRDCEDGADEAGCPPAPPCGADAFRCLDGSCVPRLWACDGDRDCPDGSDEAAPSCGPPRAPRACSPLQLRCGSGRCVPRRWRCDGTEDCADGADERGCAAVSCRPDQFSCGDGRCVPRLRRCDGETDCANGSDEAECRNMTACAGFRCRSGECIPMERVCDHRRDCRDWSDEPLKECGVNECLDGGGCSHVCRDLPLGYECLCPDGFRLGPDGRSCLDIDECQDPTACSQQCHNLPGSYKCDCGGGYRLDPGTNACRALGPPPALLFSLRHELREVALDGAGYRRLLGPLKHLGALDVHVGNGSVFWADLSRGRIYRSPLAGTANPPQQVPVVELGSGTPDAIAVDWLHHLLYWTDSGLGSVSVADASGAWSRTLLQEEGAKPCGIAVDPLQGFLYWTDWGASAKIARSRLDGSDAAPLVTEDVEWPNGITLDLPSRRLFWVDARLHALSSVDVDGGRRRTLLMDPAVLVQPFAIAVFEEWIYWSDSQLGAVFALGLRSEPGPQRLLQERFPVQGLVLVHPLRQPTAPLAPLDVALPQPPPSGHEGVLEPTTSTVTPGTPNSTGTSGNATAGSRGGAVGPVGSRTALTALAVMLPLAVLVLVGAAARGLWRWWRRRSTQSISFSNPVFRKAGHQEEEEEPLGVPRAPLVLDDDVA
ncbi:low-density lipoprotein receptor-like [Pezoporus occidentalis]|uniref:low-density lipoprotein receptor-like n=1 Tax=Pezoporus occidentalis TaxID=407982 RepID=UPI002F90FF52